MSKIKPRAGIMDIPLYQGGAAHVEGVSNVVKLSSNENPFGPSLSAIKAYEAGARSLHRYPSADHSELRAAIANVYDLDAERIICGAGSDEIIAFLCQAYAGKGDEIMHREEISGKAELVDQRELFTFTQNNHITVKAHSRADTDAAVYPEHIREQLLDRVVRICG